MRSDHGPAQNTAPGAPISSPPAMRRRTSVSLVFTAITSLPSRISPPASLTSSASARATCLKSTTPVAGECSAAMPRACGSISCSSSGPTRRSSGTSLAIPRRSSSSKRSISDCSVATISFPERRCSIPRASQYSNMSRAPSTHSLAFSEPGA